MQTRYLLFWSLALGVLIIGAGVAKFVLPLF
jgi:hypothetical protein